VVGVWRTQVELLIPDLPLGLTCVRFAHSSCRYQRVVNLRKVAFEATARRVDLIYENESLLPQRRCKIRHMFSPPPYVRNIRKHEASTQWRREVSPMLREASSEFEH
jgi:hypothetical protein